MSDTTKLIDISVSTVSLGWSGYLAIKMLRTNQENGLTLALASLFGAIGAICGWSIWVLSRFRTNAKVVTTHTIWMVGLAIILDWLNREWSK